MSLGKTLLFVKVGFLLGYYTKEKIIGWVDDLISRGNADNPLLDISLARSKGNKDFMSYLVSDDDPVGDFEKNEVKRFCFVLILQALRESHWYWPVYQNELLKLFNVGAFNLEEEEASFASRLQDHIGLINDGFDGIMDMPFEMERFLEKYSVWSNDYQSFLEKEKLPPPLIESTHHG